MSLQRIRRAYGYLRRKARLEDHFSGVKLVTDGQSIFQMYKNDGELEDLLREGQLAFFLAIDTAADSEAGRKSGHLYDREEFVEALQKAEAEVERQLPPKARQRVWASRSA
jgi:hypothetical protein